MLHLWVCISVINKLPLNNYANGIIVNASLIRGAFGIFRVHIHLLGIRDGPCHACQDFSLENIGSPDYYAKMIVSRVPCKKGLRMDSIPNIG